MTYNRSSTTTTTITMSAMVICRRSFRRSGAGDVTASAPPALDTLGHAATQFALVELAVDAQVRLDQALHREAVGPLGPRAPQPIGQRVIGEHGPQAGGESVGIAAR